MPLKQSDIMEIKPIPKIIEEMNLLVSEEKYDEAMEFAKENINLNKEYVEGELCIQKSFRRAFIPDYNQ